MSALGRQIDGIVRRDRVQIGAGGEGAVIPQILRPALPGDPFASGRLLRANMDAFQRSGFAGQLEDIDRTHRFRLRLPMQMGIGEPGQHRLAVQVNRRRAASSQPRDLCVIAHSDQPAIADRHGAGARPSIVQRDDVAIEQNRLNHACILFNSRSISSAVGALSRLARVTE